MDPTKLAEWLETDDFYTLLLTYRMASPGNQARVCQHFEAIKSAIRKKAGLEK